MLSRPVTLALIFAAWASATPFSESIGADFHQGKNIRMIVGLAAGGGYDTYTRAIARHLGKHIPGNPSVVVENMTGAGSVIAANYIYKAVKPDGLVIGHYLGGLVLQQLMGHPGIEFDARKFEYLGVPTQDSFVIVVAKSTGITDVKKWIESKRVVKFGGVAPGGGNDDIPKIVQATLGLPVRVVSGYKGSSAVRLAFNSGEVEAAAMAWESLKVTWKKEVDSGEAVMVLQPAMKSHPELKHIPVVGMFIKSEENKKLLETVLRVHGPSVRPYVLSPGTPKDRVQLIRKAYYDTLKDPEFLADTKKAQLDISPLTGEELAETVNEIFKIDQALVEKLKVILK
jgi:tripartite-type tricarboxylate transporter receptor subunit TctC